MSEQKYYAIVKRPSSGSGMWLVAAGTTPPTELDKKYPITYGVTHRWCWFEWTAQRRAKKMINRLRKMEGEGVQVIEFEDSELMEEYDRIKRELSKRKLIT